MDKTIDKILVFSLKIFLDHRNPPPSFFISKENIPEVSSSKTMPRYEVWVTGLGTFVALKIL